MWLSTNEATNKCDGVCYNDQLAESPQKHLLPYTPTGRDLETRSISLDAIHNDTLVRKQVTELDAHSLFGTMQTQATHGWFEKNNRRSMIISRSSFSGHGKFGSKWHGYSESNLDYLGYSITGVMMQNVMGIPLAGSDICGFSGDANDTLCTRWYNVGAFHPFSINNNGRKERAQEPYVFQNKTIDFPA